MSSLVESCGCELLAHPLNTGITGCGFLPLPFIFFPLPLRSSPELIDVLASLHFLRPNPVLSPSPSKMVKKGKSVAAAEASAAAGAGKKTAAQQLEEMMGWGDSA